MLTILLAIESDTHNGYLLLSVLCCQETLSLGIQIEHNGRYE